MSGIYRYFTECFKWAHTTIWSYIFYMRRSTDSTEFINPNIIFTFRIIECMLFYYTTL